MEFIQFEKSIANFRSINELQLTKKKNLNQN